MVNDNWKSQGPSYQLPARDVGFRLLGRRFSADAQSLSIKICRPAQILAGSSKRRENAPKVRTDAFCFRRSSHGRELHPDLPAIAQPFICSSGSLDLLRDDHLPYKRF